MIKDMVPLSMPESLKYIKSDETKAFAKKFTKMDNKKAEELRKKLEGLNLIKLNEKHMSKIIDLMPEEKEDVQLIVPDSNLDDEEKDAILNTIKEK